MTDERHDATDHDHDHLDGHPDDDRDAPEPVTVLGLGPMGTALAGAFLDAGHPTTVWNRSPAKADPLVERGARRAGTAAEAVAASQLVIVCVIDYDAVHAIADSAADALAGRTLVSLTADTPGRAREMAAWAAERRVGYLDGSIMTPTTTIGGPDAVILFSGAEALYERHAAALAALGGRRVHLGADPGRAAAYDVALLDMFWTAVSGIAHGFALAAAEGVSATDLAPFAKGLHELLPWTIDEFARNVDSGHHPDPVSSLRSITAGMEHVVHATRARGLDDGAIGAATALARRGVDAGYGADSMSRLTELLVRTAGSPVSG
ncbi:NAD(P)-dependent oxidoreductase [Marinitenerispora sediminis]|uniref:Dehydrogenase n=1 Tax=Marinitenerispora sediminis TaxID=1931232 RepID=A0A368T0V4_9ACTN|nr:NAD(P)-binding domain-containing protein [Marinitenerispora sediminis]RCV49991.1 dehydrogenase [Marinitenerispora sediminis]RCV51295.1 dehydrogenase [Marinitenerispora sediminis]RCV53210.1 dehydrogenase [Marinitenerispora sediminis]